MHVHPPIYWGFGVAQAPGWRRTRLADKFLTTSNNVLTGQLCSSNDKCKASNDNEEISEGDRHERSTPQTVSWFGWAQTGCMHMRQRPRAALPPGLTSNQSPYENISAYTDLKDNVRVI